jgi:hypothetical protein
MNPDFDPRILAREIQSAFAGLLRRTVAYDIQLEVLLFLCLHGSDCIWKKSRRTMNRQQNAKQGHAVACYLPRPSI